MVRTFHSRRTPCTACILLMGDNILNLADVPRFIESEWIGVQRCYPTLNTPYEVEWAKQALLKIPEAQIIHFPSPILPVTQFIQLNLAPQSAEIIMTKPQMWFSPDKPTSDITVLISRPIPPKGFLDKLTQAMGQAWFDGAKSIVDVRFNNSTDRLPLWVITFWRSMARVLGMQNMWRRSFQWLEEEGRKAHDTITIKAVDRAKDMLSHLGWNVPLPHVRQTETTAILTTLLSTAWLSDTHVDIMMEELSTELVSAPEFSKRVIIAPLAFSAKLQSMQATKHHSYTPKNALLLCRYEKHIKESGVEELYFPVHVSGNHWITGLVDFKRGNICFG